VSLAVVGRCLAHDLPERAAEGPEAREPDVEADMRDAAVGLPEEEHRAFHTTPLKVAVRRFPERCPEAADEVRLRDIGDRGDGGHVEGLRVSAVHRVAGSQQAPVQVLDVATHGRNATSSAGAGVECAPRLRG
jgi:hypothetical protein